MFNGLFVKVTGSRRLPTPGVSYWSPQTPRWLRLSGDFCQTKLNTRHTRTSFSSYFLLFRFLLICGLDFFWFKRLKLKIEKRLSGNRSDRKASGLDLSFLCFRCAENFRKNSLWWETILLRPSRSFTPSSPLSSCLTWQNITDALWDLREEGEGTQSFINTW